MEPIVLISAYLFPSYSFRKGIDQTSIINGQMLTIQWAEERLEPNTDSEFVPSQSSQLIYIHSEQDTDNDDDYVTFSLEEMMETCPRKIVKITSQLPNEQKERACSIEQEMEKFEIFIKENGIKPNNPESAFQEQGQFSRWWFYNGHNFPILN